MMLATQSSWKIGTYFVAIIHAFALVAATPGGGALAQGDQLQKNVSLENARLQSCLVESTCPVFYISALGGRFPVPMRYFLISSVDKRLDSLVFGSPLPSSALRGKSIDQFALSGVIKILPILQLQSIEHDSRFRLDEIKTVGAVTLSKLVIARNQKALGESELMTNFIIKGQKDYIWIVDVNPELAKNLFQIYLNVNTDGRQP